MIDKIIHETVLRLAERESVKPNQVSLGIYTDDEETLEPKYYYTVEGKAKKNEDGTLAHLEFNKDILGKKYDPLMRKILVANVIKRGLARYSEGYSIPVKQVRVLIQPIGEEALEFTCFLLNRSEEITTIATEEIFALV